MSTTPGPRSATAALPPAAAGSASSHAKDHAKDHARDRARDRAQNQARETDGAKIRRHKVCVDVDYRAEVVVAACVGFELWTDQTPSFESTVRSVGAAASYEPGQFYRREMPYLLGLLEPLTNTPEHTPELVIVDGYVWLDDDKPGLGAHLYEALERRCPVVGVAKRPFRGSSNAVAVLRGISKQPLFVGAVGMPVEDAVLGVRSMFGPHRVPTLLKRVDQLSRH